MVVNCSSDKVGENSLQQTAARSFYEATTDLGVTYNIVCSMVERQEYSRLGNIKQN